MGAARLQTPRRSPRQAFGGEYRGNATRWQTNKTKTLRNPQNFNYEVSYLRGHASRAQLHPRRCSDKGVGGLGCENRDK
jgi:hypothetical protein